MQIGAELLCKGGKVKQTAEYGVQSTEYGVRKDSRAKVESGLRPVQRCEDEKGVKKGTGDR